MPQPRATDRLRRLVVLVPWIIANDGATLDEVCARFDVKQRELIADLELLFLCGLPPFGPGDLIDVSFDDGRVSIRMADYMTAPPRLTRDEAVAMLVMGRAVASLPGSEGSAALTSALGKLARAIVPADAAEAEELSGRIEVDLTASAGAVLGDVRAALIARQRVHIAYYTFGRAEMTERDIDPLLLVPNAGNWYVVACDHRACDSTHRACEVKTFRTDRIRDLVPTGATFEFPDGFDPDSYTGAPVYTPSKDDMTAVIELDPDAAWIREIVPAESVDERDGRIRITLRTAHVAWLVRLLLSAAPHARALEPASLVEAVRDAAARALARYGVR